MEQLVTSEAWFSIKLFYLSFYVEQLVTNGGVVLHKALLSLFCRVVMWNSWLLAEAWHF